MPAMHCVDEFIVRTREGSASAGKAVDTALDYTHAAVGVMQFRQDLGRGTLHDSRSRDFNA